MTRDEPDIQPYEVEVVGVRPLTPSIVRIEVQGAAPEPLGVPDEGCVLHVPLAGGGRDTDGRWYTVRACNGSRHTFDIVTHEGGIGASWARRATVGDRIGISGRQSWFKRPADARWQVLIGDIAGLPAISRIAEEAPAGVATTAVVEVPTAADRLPIERAATTWVHNPDPAAGSRLEELARGIDLPVGSGYVYVAGEAAATRGVRKYLRHELGMAAGTYGVVGYWRVDAERWRRRYESSVEVYEKAWEHAEQAGRDEEESADIYEADLAKAGLL
ncbi:siderophore-interacting protein [Pseudonocardia sp. GCM10023141]|uniref:siderophore-interacting protein n=1 Tax=Pseudonocardia sp. GCM10023141 TaxID=3252653 RepID=UPI00362030BA